MNDLVIINPNQVATAPTRPSLVVVGEPDRHILWELYVAIHEWRLEQNRQSAGSEGDNELPAG